MATENQLHSINHGIATQTKKRKYLIFSLGEDQFAVPLSNIKEVIGLTELTPVPNMPAFFRGLLNLRGRVISVVDLKEKLSSMIKRENSNKPCIIISEVDGILLGAIVDDVVEVNGIDENQVQRDLDLASSISKSYLLGAAKIEGRPLTLLLDIGKVLDVEELKTVKEKTYEHKAA